MRVGSLVRNGLLPLGQQVAPVNPQTTKLTLAVGAIKMDVKKNVVVFYNVERGTLR